MVDHIQNLHELIASYVDGQIAAAEAKHLVTISGLEESLRIAEENLAISNSDNAVLRADVARLTTELEEARRLLADVRTAAAVREAEQNERIGNLEADVSDLRENVQDLQIENAALRQQLEEANGPRVLTAQERDAAYADLVSKQKAWSAAYAANPATAGPMPLWIPTPENTGLIDKDEFAPYGSGEWIEVLPGADGWIRLKNDVFHEGKRFWGPVKFDSHDVKGSQCVFTGRDPLATIGGNVCIQNYGSDPKRFGFTDSLVDPHLWLSVRGYERNPAKPTSLHGLHGGNSNLNRVEMRHVEDGLQGVGRSSGDPTQQKNVWTCVWVHAHEYRAAVPGLPDDSRTHPDSVQIVYGRNWEFNNCTFGGERDTKGYLTWEGAYNSGDDPQLNCVLIQQHDGELADNRWVGNIKFSFCRFRGGLSTLTLAYSSTFRLQNDLSTVSFEHGTVLRRKQGWGEALTGAVKSDYTAGYVRVFSNGGLGHYALVHDNIRATGFRDLVIEESDGTVTNEKIVVSRG